MVYHLFRLQRYKIKREWQRVEGNNMQKNWGTCKNLCLIADWLYGQKHFYPKLDERIAGDVIDTVLQTHLVILSP